MGEVLVVLAVLLLVVMLVGHSMWVALAWLFRTLAGAGEPPDQPLRPAGQLRLRDELHITIHQLQRLGRTGVIPSEQCERLVAALHAELAALSPGRPAARPMAREQFARALPASEPEPSAVPVQTPASLAAFTQLEIVDAVLVEAVSPSLPPADVHPLDRPYVPPPPAAPSQPGRSLADMLQSFMEESNIRWGEILAAMLIVLCSVGLVISLRNTLRNVPYFPAILFTLFTLAFHGAGMYTLRRWKIQAVSRVILIISLLLIPLTFCGTIILQDARPAGDPLFLVALLAGVGIFTWVAYSASRELVGASAAALTVSILGCSLAQVFIQRIPLDGIGFWRLNSVAALPLVSFLVAAVWQIVRARTWRQLSRPRVIEILRVLGVALFALLVPLALILVRSQPRVATIANLGPQLSLAVAAVLALGLIIQRRTIAKRLIAWQTVGTAILVLAGFVLVLLVAAAWPEPELLLALGLMNGAILAVLAVLADLPLLFAPSVACAALAATIGMHLMGGQFADRTQLAQKLIQAALMGRTSLLFSVLAAIAAAIAFRVRQYPFAKTTAAPQRLTDTLLESPRLTLLASSGGLAALGIAIAMFSGFVRIEHWPQDSDLSAFLLVAYAAALVAASPFAKRPEPAYAGAILLWLGLAQALVFNATVRDGLAAAGWLPTQSWLMATISQGVISALIAIVAAGRRLSASVSDFAEQGKRPGIQCLAEPLAQAAAISLVAALPFIVWVRGDQFVAAAVMAGVAALAWALLAAAQRWPWAVSGLETMVTLTPALVIAGNWKAHIGEPGWWHSEQHLYAQLIAAALGTLIWSAARRAARANEALRALLNPPWLAVDQVVLGVATIGLPILALLAAAPAVGWELGYGLETASPLHAEQGWMASGRGWIALAVVVIALLVSLWECVSLPAAVGVGIASFAAVWLAASQWEASVAAASAARWGAAIFAAVWAAAFVARDPLHAAAKRFTALRWQRWPSEASQWFCAQPLLFGGTTILMLTIIAVQQHAGGVMLRGPLPGSLFAVLGPTISYVTPLATLVAVLLAYSIRQREARFALGGAAVSQLAANLAYLLYVDDALSAEARGVIWLQWNSIAAGAYSLVWHGLSPWMAPQAAGALQVAGKLRVPFLSSRGTSAMLPNDGTRSVPVTSQLALSLWLIPLAVAGVAAVALSGWATLYIVDRPAIPAADLQLIGGWPSYLAVALVLAAVLWRSAGKVEFPGLGDAALWLVAGVVPLVAASASALDGRGMWLAYHTLQAGWLAVAIVACAVFVWKSWAPRSRLLPHHASIAVLAGFVLFLGVRGVWHDPGQPWWSVGAALACCGLATALGLKLRSQPYAYASTLISALPVMLFWMAPATASWIDVVFPNPRFDDLGVLELVVLSVTLAAGYWLSREIACQHRLSQSFDVRRLPPVHSVVAAVLIPLYFVVRLALALFMEQRPVLGYDITAAVTTLALGGLALMALWDRRGVLALPLSYVWLLALWCLVIVIGRAWLDSFGSRLVALSLATAAQLAVTGHLWSYGANLAAWGERWGIPDPVGGLVRAKRWLIPTNLLLAAGVCVAAVTLVLTLEELPLRVAAACGPAIIGYGLLCLAQENRRDTLQLASLLMAGLTAVCLAWSQIDPTHDADVWLTRVFRLLMVLAALAFVYGLVVPRFLLVRGSWNAATRKAGYLAGAAALVTLVVTLALETTLFVPGVGAQVETGQVAAIAVVLVGLIAGLLSLAVLPGRDPLVLSEKGRQGYVYAAEVTVALLFAHLYICRPLWFDSVLRPYWPFLVMGLAFVGAGAAEIFARARIRVLAEPLANTSSLLPLLPVLGWWVAGSHVDYALLLLVVGILYLALSYTRKSWAAMLAAAVAGNGALWSLLSEQDFSFVGNPQLWLIPPALSVLLAAHLNRRRLAADALAAIRYAATIVIYASSTTEIVTRGFDGGVLPPMALLGLAVVGALAGIALRVRAFLVLGSTFTLVALIAMVRHASQSIHHVWPWWVFGIALGVAILVLFAVFEKKKPEVMLLITRLRQWER